MAAKMRFLPPSLKRAAPSSLLWTLAVFMSFALIWSYLRHFENLALPPASPSAVLAPDIDPAPPGHFDPALFEQGVSHDQFHLRAMKLRLAAMVRLHKRVAIVGVEGGHDVIHFALDGYETHAFEPMSSSIEHVRSWAERSKIKGIHLHHVAASNVSGKSITAAYLTGSKKEYEKVSTARVDDSVTGGLDVLSADIQGNEWDVVQGAMRIINGPGVRSMWIEIHPCNPRVPPMLAELDRLGYVMFDMVPIGATRATKERETLIEAANAARLGWYTRPPRFDHYFDWMCKIQKEHWLWLQTDVLAIKREILTDDMMLKIKSLSSALLNMYEREGKLK